MQFSMRSVPGVFGRLACFLTRGLGLCHAFHHRVMVHWHILRHCLILSRRQAWKLPDERDHIPDKTIIVRFSPRRHGGHLDSMLDDPELLRGRTIRTFEQDGRRSEEHTSELQSLMRISYAVFCLKKKKQNKLSSSLTQYMIL